MNLSSPSKPKVLAGSVLLLVLAASAAVLFMHHGSQAPPKQGDSGCTAQECGSADKTPTRPPVRTDRNAFNKGLMMGRSGVTQGDPNFFCTSGARNELRFYPQDPSAQGLYLQGCFQGANGG